MQRAKVSQISETKIVTATHTVTRFCGGDLIGHIRSIAGERRTGALTILFSQGGICALEWRDKGTYNESFGEPWGNVSGEMRR